MTLAHEILPLTLTYNRVLFIKDVTPAVEDIGPVPHIVTEDRMRTARIIAKEQSKSWAYNRN